MRKLFSRPPIICLVLMMSFVISFLLWISSVARGAEHSCDNAPLMEVFSVTDLAPATKHWLASNNFTLTVAQIQLPHEFMHHEREPGAYVRMILDAIDRRCLAKVVAFVHGHEVGWHQNQPMLTILKSSLKAVQQFNFDANEDCAFGPSLWFTNKVAAFSPEVEGFWETYMLPFLVPIRDFNRPVVGECLIIPCCAQFLVSRERILRLPVSLYRSILDYQQTHHYIPGEKHWISQQGILANAMEYHWPILYTAFFNTSCLSLEAADVFRPLFHAGSSLVGDSRCFPVALAAMSAPETYKFWERQK